MTYSKGLPHIAIVGCGVVGSRRAICFSKEAIITVCCDRDKQAASLLASQFSEAAVETDWRVVVRREDVDLVVVATPHSLLAEIAYEAATCGKYVLVEKPVASSASELEPLLRFPESRSLVRIGFNHRYHRAFLRAKKMCEDGAIGQIMFLRACYGHGGRKGYEREWRCNPEHGGGELLDQGTHLIDLARWFVGDLTLSYSSLRNYFWNCPVEDNAFLALETATGQMAWVQASWTEWANQFRFEIFGTKGKLEVSGLGGSYGVERLHYYRMLQEMGPPETTTWSYPMTDNSWNIEVQDMLEDMRLSRHPSPGLDDAYAVLQLVDGARSEKCALSTA